MHRVSRSTGNKALTPSATEPSPRTLPAGSVVKNLHAGFRTGNVWMSVLLLVTVVPFIGLVLGALLIELTGTRWLGAILAGALCLVALLGAVSLVRSLFTRGYVLIMDDRGLSYDQQKKHRHPIAWNRILRVEQSVAVDDRHARFQVVYRTGTQDTSSGEGRLSIEQSQLDVSSTDIRAVFESRIGPLNRVEQHAPDTWGDKLQRGVTITAAAAITEKLRE